MSEGKRSTRSKDPVRDRRTSKFKELANLSSRIDNVLSEEEDGETYSYRLEPRCKVCNADEDVRKLIDTLLVYPKSYTETLELVQPLLDAKQVDKKKRPSYNSIRNHQKNHLPFDKLAVREIAERRAQERGKDIVQGKDNMFTAEALLEAIAREGWQKLHSGEVSPTISEAMNAALKLDQLEKQAEHQTDQSQLLIQLNIVIQSVKEIVPASMWEQIAEKIEDQERRMGLVEDNESNMLPGNDEDIVDAEIVDDEF